MTPRPKSIYHYKPDANEKEIDGYLKDAGWTVINTARIGGGFPDRVVYCPVWNTHGFWDVCQVRFIEIKTATGKLTEREQEWWTEHKDLVDAGMVKIVRNQRDVEAL